MTDADLTGRPPPVGDPRLLDDAELARRLEPIAWHVFHASPRPPGVEADDLMQVIRLTLWRKARDFDPARGCKLTTWLYTSANWCWQTAAAEARLVDRNGLKNVRRRVRAYAPPAGRVRTNYADADGEDLLALVPARAAGAEAAEAAEAAAALLAKVTNARAREALRLVAVEGLTLRAAGARMGVSRGRVDQLRDLALHQLRAALTPDGGRS